MSATMIAITLTKGLISLPMDIILHNDYFEHTPDLSKSESISGWLKRSYSASLGWFGAGNTLEFYF